MSNQSADITRGILAAQKSAHDAAASASLAQQTALQVQQLYNIMIQFTTTWKGPWSFGVFYRSHDSVSFNGSSYIAILNGADNQPDISPSFWNVVAEGSGGGGAPSGPAGGDLAGTYPNPAVGTHSVAYGKIQQVAASHLVGNPTGSIADVQEISLGSGLAFSGSTLVNTGSSTPPTATSPIHVTSNNITKDPWSNSAQRFVSPTGNDSNDGLGWDTAFKTGFKGFAAIQAAHGGRLYIAQGSSWIDNSNLQAGQVANQGAWINGPGVLAGAGFQLGNWPTIIEGIGASQLNGFPTPFQDPGAAALFGGSNLLADHRTKPGIWLVQTVAPIVFRNIEPCPTPGAEDGQIGLYCAVRQGWDYIRNSDTSIGYQAISSSTRAAGSTVHTVALFPAANIDSAVRTLNPGASGGSTNPADYTTTLHMSASTSGLSIPAPPWEIGTKLYFASTSGSFTSGPVTTFSVNATQLGTNDWTVTCRDGGIVPVTVANPGTVRSIVSSPGDLLDLESTSSEFPSGQYAVTDTAITSSSTGTVTVKDIYGSAALGNSPSFGPTASIGRLVHQSRSYWPTVSVVFDGVAARGPFTEDVADSAYFRFGPMFDIGSATAFFPTMANCYMEGIKPSVASGLPYDDLRMTSCLVQGGTVTTPGLIVRHTRGVKAGFRCVFSNVSGGGSTGSFDLDDFLTDCDNGEAPALYDIDSSSATDVIIRRCSAADANPGFGADLNRIAGAQPLKVRGDATATGSGWVSAAPEMGSSSISGAGSSGGAGLPWAFGANAPGRVVIWTPDLQISGKHPAAWRHAGITSRRFIEQSTGYPSPIATGITDPFGGTGAVRYDDTSGIIYLHSFAHTFNFVAGDVIAVSGWVNVDSKAGFFDADTFFEVIIQGGTAPEWVTGGNSWIKAPTIYGPGWQFVTYHNTVASGSGTSNLQVGILPPVPSGGGHMDLFGWSIAYIPASAGLNPNDIGEWVGTRAATPLYLPVGQAGTFEGQKMIAHGGLGIDTSVVSNPGNTDPAIAKWEPRYAADGTTVQGYSPLFTAAARDVVMADPRAGAALTNADATVNPATDSASIYTLPPATLTGPHVLTLGVTGSPITGSVVQIVRRDLTGNTFTVQDDASTPLIVFGATPATAQGATFYFNGTHYAFLSFYYVK